MGILNNRVAPSGRGDWFCFNKATSPFWGAIWVEKVVRHFHSPVETKYGYCFSLDTHITSLGDYGKHRGVVFYPYHAPKGASVAQNNRTNRGLEEVSLLSQGTVVV